MELQQSLRDTQKAAQAIEDMFLCTACWLFRPNTDMQVEPAETQANIPALPC